MKKVLVYGLGVSGISTVKTLSRMGYEVYTYDKNKIEIEELKGYDYSPISDEKIFENDYEYVVKAPGIKPADELVQKLENKCEVLSDIELSYRLFPYKKFIAVTGTNGKTSTTSMVTHILNEAGVAAKSVGNIGEGILWSMYTEDVVFVEELSSFQLKHTYNYHPHIATILNISPDHLDWHPDYEDYISSKFNIAKNQTTNDYLVLNHDDEILNGRSSLINADIYEFSTKSEVDRGIYLKDGLIYFAEDGKRCELMNVSDLKIIGEHNYQNIMAAMLMTYLYGVEFEDIIRAATTFRSIEHRLEYVNEYNGVKVYNDSKATNVDSAIKAIDSFTNPLIIIAGGYDKNIDYRDFVKAFSKHGKLMVLIGETKYMLKDLCEEYDIDYKLCDNMDSAVSEATKAAEPNDVILLSPASASWDMYTSFEKRGEDFKEKIEKYKGQI